SLSAKASHRLFQGRDVAQSMERRLAGRLRIHAARDELARPTLDVQAERFVDFLVDRQPPQPRAKGPLHVERKTLDTPVVNRRQVALSPSGRRAAASVE